MKKLVCGLVLAALAVAAQAPAQSPAPPSRVFAAPADQVFDVTESVLRSLGWSVDQKDKANGWILTDARSVDFRNFGVYGEGARHKLRLTVKAAGEGRATVTVERELYREERILWMVERKPLPAADRSVETAVLDGIESSVPAVAAAPAPRTVAAPPSPAAAPSAPPAAPATPSTVARSGQSRGEFTFKVTYRVKGTAGSVALTYRNAKGGTEQGSVRLPWEMSFDAKGGSFLYVSAQNQSASGSVTCEILLDDESRTSSTSNGAYVIAECSNAAERN